MTGRSGDEGRKFPNLSRRQFIGASGASALGLYLAKSGLVRPGLAKPAVSGEKNAFGLTLPADAAPASQQFLVSYFDSVGQTYKAMDFYETVYSRAPLADNFNHSLVRINSDYQIVPGTASHWAQTSATTWEFHIRPGIMWSDGNELTANDYVETLRYSADPKHAWDFAWYWSGVIKNYTEAVAGKAPVNSIGVSVGSNKYTFVVTTEGPVAFIPSAMLYSQALSAAGLAKYGNGLYNINPATCISCGPYVLKTFNPTAEVVLARTRSTRPPTSRRSNTRWARSTPVRTTSTVRDRCRRLHDDALTKTDLAVVKGNPDPPSSAVPQPAGLPGLLRLLQDQEAAFQQPKGTPGLCPRGRPQRDHQGPAPRPGDPGLRLPDGWLPIRHQPAAREVHQLRPGAGAKADGRSWLPEGQGLPVGDLQLPGRQRAVDSTT